MSKKHKKVCMASNYIKQLLISVFVVTGSVSISVFASLDVIFIGIASSAAEINICSTAV